MADIKKVQAKINEISEIIICMYISSVADFKEDK